MQATGALVFMPPRWKAGPALCGEHYPTRQSFTYQDRLLTAAIPAMTSFTITWTTQKLQLSRDQYVLDAPKAGIDLP